MEQQASKYSADPTNEMIFIFGNLPRDRMNFTNQY